ncbi:MAG: hypothetical protein JXA82_18160 [Sedimentisphaerales bacterium]|nr:hypothetical protein [Sedimentisphaerales bacterium]
MASEREYGSIGESASGKNSETMDLMERVLSGERVKERDRQPVQPPEC